MCAAGGQKWGQSCQRESTLAANSLKQMAPQAGFEPATLRLTAGCSAVELLRNMSARPLTCSAPAGTTNCSGMTVNGSTQPNEPSNSELGTWNLNRTGTQSHRHDNSDGLRDFRMQRRPRGNRH